jgi:TPR repeat protein
MNTSRSQLLARCTLWMGALFAATALHAGPAEDLAQADAALASGDLPTGMQLLRKAADQNEPRAQARLADLLRAAEKEKEAVALYRKSADQGDAAGEFGLGRAYADGAGVEPNPALALELYRKAEKKNHAAAIDALARAYRSGSLGLPRDLEQARVYEERLRDMTRAANQGAAR